MREEYSRQRKQLVLRAQGRGPPGLSRNSGENTSEAKLAKGKIRRCGQRGDRGIIWPYGIW